MVGILNYLKKLLNKMILEMAHYIVVLGLLPSIYSNLSSVLQTNNNKDCMVCTM